MFSNYKLAIWLFASGGYLAAAAPCDIYAAGGTPCVAAHSTTRSLYSAYSGNLYQVQRSDGTTLNITPVQDGVAPAAIQYSYAGGTLTYAVTAFGANTPVSYPLLANTDQVTANSFNVALQTCQQNQQTVTQSVTATIGFMVAGQPLTMHASASVRQNQTY